MLPGIGVQNYQVDRMLQSHESLFFLIWIALFSILFLSVFSSFFHFFLIEWLFLFFHRGENNIIPKPVSLLHLLHKKSTGRS